MDVIQFLYTIPGLPLGYLLYFIYNCICSNVGIAILIFTFIVKLALLPIYIKQQKNTAKSAIFQPKVQEIQQKYKNNQQKQQEELMKLQSQGYKPMSGCAPMLVSFVILFGVIDVVYKPLTHIVHMDKTAITALVEESYDVELTSALVEECMKTESEVAALDENAKKKHDNIVRDAKKILDYYNEHCLSEGEKALDISVFSSLDTDTVKIVKTSVGSIIKNEYAADTSDKKKAKTLADTDIYKITDAEKAERDALATDEEKANYTAEHSFSSETVGVLGNLQAHYGYYTASSEESAAFQATAAMQRELYALERFGSKVGTFACKNAYSERAVRPEVKAELDELYDNLNFIGIPLGQIPKDNMGFPMILVPIVSFLMALLQTFVSNRIMAKTNPEASSMMGPMKITMYIMPLISLYIAFTVPAGAGFYWTINYVFGILQTIALNKLYDPAKLREAAEAEYAEKNKKTVNVEAVKVKNADGSEETLSQKEINRRKLAAARKADAEKYGEEYHEDDDN